MPTNYTNLENVKAQLKEAQDAESDIRERARDADHFVNKIDGQWEPDVLQQLQRAGRPRYTFDKTNPIIDQVVGEMDNADFTLKVRPSGGQATKGNAKVFDGMIRNIMNISNAENVFHQASKGFVTTGMDGWEVVQDWVDADAFEQDLFIRKVHNYIDRVWFLGNPQEQDNSDAPAVVKLSSITMREYDDQFPKAKSHQSIGDDRSQTVYTWKHTDLITIGQILYKKPRDIEIVQMSNGAVYQVDEKFEQVRDELAQAGITEERRRIRKSHRVYSRLFNNDEWLNEEEETVFDFLPICAVYGNYEISESKRIHRGIVEKLMDEQRVYNYAVSREIEEGALAPRAKYWMTNEQVEGHTATLATMNTNCDPVQIYNHVDNQPPPFWQGGSQVNPGLQATAQRASEDLNASAGLFSANMGDNPGLQSGVAIDRQVTKGDNSTTKWFRSMEYAQCYMGKVLINAIPRVYDSTRQVRMINADGSFEMQTLNQKVFDQDTQQMVEINNLAAGQYDVVCESGLNFKSQQRETAAAFAEIAGIDPTVMEMARDVWFKNLDALGMDEVSARARQMLLQQGLIPEEQWTDEERQKAAEAQAQAAQQAEQPDPAMVLAQAEQAKAEADQMNAQVKIQQVQGEQQIKALELQLEEQKIQLDIAKFQREKDDKFNVEAAKISQGQQKIDQDDLKIQLQQQQQQFENALAVQRQQMESLSAAVEQMKGIREASGADAIIGDGIVNNFKTQSAIVAGEQKEVD
jgi:hypothetical protein